MVGPGFEGLMQIFKQKLYVKKSNRLQYSKKKNEPWNWSLVVSGFVTSRWEFNERSTTTSSHIYKLQQKETLPRASIHKCA